MNPGLVRPPNTGLVGHVPSNYGEAQRGPLLKLAGLNVPTNSPARHSILKSSRTGSPPGKPHHKPSLSQHTAHGLHGPAHSTAGRALSSSINPHHATHPTASGIRKVEIGKYDGGLEADEAGRDAVTGDAAKVLEMDSSTTGCMSILPSGFEMRVDMSSAGSIPLSLPAFTIGRPLGKGKFGRVYLARTRAPPYFIVALKCLHKTEIVVGKVEKQVRREIEIQQNLR